MFKTTYISRAFSTRAPIGFIARVFRRYLLLTTFFDPLNFDALGNRSGV
jgi:hypothetical protein